MQRKRLGIITDDDLFYKRIFLLEGDELDCIRVSSASELSGFELCIFDTRSKILPCPSYAIRIGEGEELSLPLSLPKIKERVRQRNSSVGRRLLIDGENSFAMLDGEKIKLTDTEERLLSLLLTAEDYVSRSEILDKVFHGNENGGLINVYIHYLREKLEKRGERIILSSRNLGYKIDERFKVAYADNH